MTEFAVRRAREQDGETLAEVLATAFMPDPVSCWIFPDAADRARLHPAFFRIFVDLALADGEIYATDDLHAVSLWLPVDVQAHQEGDASLAEQMTKHCGDYAQRFAVLDQLMAEHHPQHESHWYLAFLAVAPGFQGRGLGGALLRHRLHVLDAAGSPAYLEASSPRNATLYTRLGFAPIGAGLHLPEGPSLIPMWRPASG